MTAGAPAPRRALLLVPVGALFLLSGATGLLYEVLWSRQLARVLGGTYPAVVAVVAAFLGGLALGAALGGRFAPRLRRPLRAYALLEAGIGIYCAAFPLLLGALHPVLGAAYRGLADQPALHTAVRFLLAGALLLPPTAAMGATLPVLVRAVVGTGGGVLGGTGLLYGLNTVGAAGGAMATGFALLPALGFAGTLLCGVGANLAVGALAWILEPAFARGRGAPPPAEEPADAPSPPAPAAAGEEPAPALRAALLALAAGSGFAGMLYQLGWTRALLLVFGSSVHAFTLVVTAFILGLGLGGLLAPLARDRGSALAGPAALVSAAVGITAWSSVVQISVLPLAAIDLVAGGFPPWGDLLRWEFLRALGIALLPTLGMGALFPLLVAALAPAAAAAPRAVGRVYAANTLGVIAGALGGGMVLLPLLGTRATLLAGAALHFLLAAAVAAAALRPARACGAAAALGAGGAALLLLAPDWPPARMHSGPLLYGPGYARNAAAHHATVARHLRDLGWDLPYDADGRSVAVAVFRGPDGNLVLRVNGKTDASSAGDMDTQLGLGHLPMLVHGRPDRVLVVGLASGVTAGAAAAWGPGALDVAEIAPEVAAAEPLFRGVNGDPLSRPFSRLLLEDGRTHLEHSGESYDVIVSEPPNPWVAGASDLFTLEYFRTCRGSLRPGGVAGVWLQSYGLTLDDYRLVVRTFLEVFPDGVVFELDPYADYLLLGSREGNADLVGGLAARPWPEGEAAASLARAGLHRTEDALAMLFLDRAATGLLAAGGEGNELHTDDLLQLEFRAPRRAFAAAGVEVLGPGVLDGLRDPGSLPALPGVGEAAMQAALLARSLALEGHGVRLASGDRGRARRIIQGVLRDPALLVAILPLLPAPVSASLAARATGGRADLSPGEEQWILRGAALLRLEAAAAAGHGELWARESLGKALEDRAQAHAAAGDLDAADRDLARARELLPGSALLPHHQAVVAARRAAAAGGGPSGDPWLRRGLRHLDDALVLNPRCEPALVQRGNLLQALGESGEAAGALARALSVRPDSVAARVALARLHRAAGRRDEALVLLDEALDLHPDHPEALLLRIEILRPH